MVIYFTYVFQDDLTCPMCGRIWRIPGPVPQNNQFPQLIDTPPFTTPTRESTDFGPTSSTPTQFIKSERKITQVYVCPNLWCDYMIHDTPQRSIPRCKQILRRLVPTTVARTET